MHQAKTKRGRSKGFTLVELVVGMTAGVLLFALAIGTVERTMKVSRDASTQMEHRIAVARLGQQLRSDVHQASEIQSTTQDAVTQLTLKGDQLPETVYKFDGALITREAPSQQSATMQRETFRLASSCSVRVDVANAERLELSVMRHTPEGAMLDSRLAARASRWVPLQSPKKGP